jgi:hypothetical protein
MFALSEVSNMNTKYIDPSYTGYMISGKNRGLNMGKSVHLILP